MLTLFNVWPTFQLFMDGPFGSTHQDWYKYETVVLIGAGIGVTPNSSVLKDLVYKVYSVQSEIACKHVRQSKPYFNKFV